MPLKQFYSERLAACIESDYSEDNLMEEILKVLDEIKLSARGFGRTLSEVYSC